MNNNLLNIFLETMLFGICAGVVCRLGVIAWGNFFHINFNKSELGVFAGILIGLFMLMRAVGLSLRTSWIFGALIICHYFLIKLIIKRFAH